ncbi:MAG: hypothetical protein JW724_03110 [Candidatus Altiarchaeota archaeon]|nr:hypothetical protein [Candidatus Altiarchaeota archaeon]
MKVKAIILLTAIALGFSLNSAWYENSFAKDKRLAPEEVVAAHLKSMGTPELLASAKNRGVSGKAFVQFVQGGVGTLDGKFYLLSAGRSLSIILKYTGAPAYPGEYFAYDEKDVEVSTISPGQRSPLGDFIFRYKGLMKEGLLGGVWSLGWALLDVEKRNASLKYDSAKVEGRELHQIDYKPKGGMNDIKVKLFFEPGTFRHVRTEYTLRVQGEQALQAGQTVTQGTPRSEGLSSSGKVSGSTTRDAGILDPLSYSYYRLVEKFDGFKEARFTDENGTVTGILILPHSYSLEYSVEGQGSSFLANWSANADQWVQLKSINASVFKAH